MAKGTFEEFDQGTHEYAKGTNEEDEQTYGVDAGQLKVEEGVSFMLKNYFVIPKQFENCSENFDWQVLLKEESIY